MGKNKSDMEGSVDQQLFGAAGPRGGGNVCPASVSGVSADAYLPPVPAHPCTSVPITAHHCPSLHASPIPAYRSGIIVLRSLCCCTMCNAQLTRSARPPRHGLGVSGTYYLNPWKMETAAKDMNSWILELCGGDEFCGSDCPITRLTHFVKGAHRDDRNASGAPA